jgi:hypothetical protein
MALDGVVVVWGGGGMNLGLHVFLHHPEFWALLAEFYLQVWNAGVARHRPSVQELTYIVALQPAEFLYPASWLADQRLYRRYAERLERQRSLDPPALT